MNDNKYYVETEVAEDKYVYVFDNNFNYINSYNLSDNEALNLFFYIYNEMFVWVDIFGDESPFNVKISFYDDSFNFLGTDNFIVLFNNSIFNFLMNSSGSLVISDILTNSDYTLNSEIFDSKVNFYKIIYDLKTEDSTNGKYIIEQDGDLGKIVITSDDGYVLDDIKIVDAGGHEKDYYEKNDNYYFELEDGLVLSVTFKEAPKSIEDVKNPETLDMFRLMLVSLISFIVIYFVSFIGFRVRKFN